MERQPPRTGAQAALVPICARVPDARCRPAQVQGPFQPWRDRHRARLSELSGMRDLHYVYVCRKRVPPKAPPPVAEHASAGDAG